MEILLNKQTVAVVLVASIFALTSPLPARAAIIGKPANNLGLIGYWSFNDGTSTKATDFSGNNASGSLVGSTPPSWTNGKLGMALSFDGSSSYVDFGAAPGPTGAVTISAWVKKNADVAWASILDRYDSESLDCLSLGFDDTNGKKLMFMWDNSEPFSNRVVANSDVPTGAWTHVVASSDGSTVTFYINGVADGTGSVGAPCTTGNLYAGVNFAGGDEFLNGTIDEIRLYNRALTAAQVQSLYLSSNARFGSSAILGQGALTQGLVGLWTFDGADVSGTTASDRGSGGHNMTLTAGPARAAGRIGQGLSFDGTDDYAITSNMGAQASSLTFSVWFKLNSLANSSQSILAIQDSTSPISGYHYSALGIYNGNLTGSIWDIGNITSGTALETGAWYHAILTYDASNSTQKLYLNGALVDQNTGSASAPGANMYFYLGQRQQSCSFTTASSLCDVNAQFFNGVLDDFRYYNRALSAAEARALYNLGTAKVNTASNNLHGSGLANGLVGLWTFDGGDLNSTTATDRSGQGNDETLSGSPTPTIGKLGQALAFNGSSSYLRRATFTSQPTSAMTLCAWIRTSYTGGDQQLFNINRNSGNIVNEGVFKIIDGKLRFWDYNGSSYGFADGATDSTTTVTDGEWHHVCFVKNGTAGAFYFDGAADGTKTAALNVSYGSADWVLGLDYRDTTKYFNGSMDDARVYNRALSAAEIKQLYNLGR